MKRFHTKGKLLLSAEYMVMFGARALALPLKLGQSLEISPAREPGLFTWTASHNNTPWFTANLDPATLEPRTSSDPEMARSLKRLLEACIKLRPSFRKSINSSAAFTRLDFPPDYGFGSSSTLIALVAMWAKIPPLDLHFRVAKGSGYDVACAISDGPISYQLKDQKPAFSPVPFNPPFRDQIWFAWLGNKQATAPHLAEISGRLSPNAETIQSFSRYTQDMLKAVSLSQFRETIERHEIALSRHLGIKPISEQFPYLPGSVKSLGAWGGDFIMIVSEEEKTSLKKYLGKYGIHTLYSYKELVYEEKPI